MSTNDTGLWESLKRRRSTAFLIAGLMFAVDAAIVAAVIGPLGEQYMLLGQAFVAAGWTAGFVGLLGVFPGLADRSRRLAQADADEDGTRLRQPSAPVGQPREHSE